MEIFSSFLFNLFISCRKKRMFLPKHLKNYELPDDIKECILSDGHLVDLVPDVALVGNRF